MRRPSTPPVSLSQSWVMVGADGTEQPQLPSPVRTYVHARPALPVPPCMWPRRPQSAFLSLTTPPPTPSQRPSPYAARPPPPNEHATSLAGSELSDSHGELSLNPEDVEALSSAMLASMGGSAATGPAAPVPPVVPPSPQAAEEAGETKEEEGKEEGGVDAGSDGADWLKSVASYLVRRLRSVCFGPPV